MRFIDRVLIQLRINSKLLLEYAMTTNTKNLKYLPNISMIPIQIPYLI